MDGRYACRMANRLRGRDTELIGYDPLDAGGLHVRRLFGAYEQTGLGRAIGRRG